MRCVTDFTCRRQSSRRGGQSFRFLQRLTASVKNIIFDTSRSGGRWLVPCAMVDLCRGMMIWISACYAKIMSVSRKWRRMSFRESLRFTIMQRRRITGSFCRVWWTVIRFVLKKSICASIIISHISQPLISSWWIICTGTRNRRKRVARRSSIFWRWQIRS